ncbi:hypothetical protein SAMN02910298_02854 [Pseudobutyrivibrio sp. YE44]|uniref:hypothetical protein n=1 Tax=Pseudobutyrivibrio sp. YE44 TaxID=1520802 RepID=UPI0008921D91|nr:hypothetical protein [Pseudobutyrivibrio sp. YE44]SDB55571.1 hypothetical protein SAMN02910298_02854 [Pseudobutyrivibrio sp. YE44]
MRKGNFKVRVLSTGMAVIMIMTSFTPLLSQAAELPDEEYTYIEQAAEENSVEETTIESSEVTIEDQLPEETPTLVDISDDEISPETSEATEDDLLNEDEETEEELEEVLKEEDDEEDELPPRHERIFGEVNGVYREFIIESQDTDLETPWKDENGNEYTWDYGSLCWRDAQGHLFMVDMSYVDPYYGEMCYGDSTDDMVNTSKKLAQSSMNSMIDILCKQCPELALLAGPLKAIVGEIFGLGGSKDSNKIIVDKLKEIDDELKRIESDQRYHVEDVAAMTAIGERFQNLKDSIRPLKVKIGDKLDDYQEGRITEEEFNKQVAALYNSTEYSAVTLALSGTTNAFFEETNYTVDKISIFDATYNVQCNHAMFSGEVIDRVTPYLIRQLTTYLQAYGLINTVLDCCEATTAVGSVKETRKTMLEDTGGVFDGVINANNPGVFGQYEKFFNRSRYIFVDQTSDTSRHVALKQDIYVIMDYEKYSSNGKMGLKDAVAQQKNFPLKEEQMKRLYTYANTRNITIYSLLLDNVGFKLDIVPNESLRKRFSNGISGKIDENFTTHHLHRGAVTMKQQFRNSDMVYMPYGPQDFTYKTYYSSGYCAPPYDYTMQAVRITKTGAENETIKLVGTHGTGFINPHMFFFQK